MSETLDIISSSEGEIKAGELSAKLGFKVHSFCFKGDKGEDDYAIGYIKEPDRIVKARAIDKMYQGETFSVGFEIIEACIKSIPDLREATDLRILSEASENDKYALGACKYAGELIKFSIDQTKKK